MSTSTTHPRPGAACNHSLCKSRPAEFFVAYGKPGYQPGQTYRSAEHYGHHEFTHRVRRGRWVKMVGWHASMMAKDAKRAAKGVA